MLQAGVLRGGKSAPACEDHGLQLGWRGWRGTVLQALGEMADYGLSLSRSDLSVFFYYRAIGTSGCWMRWPEGFYVFPTEPCTKAGLESRNTVPSRLSKDGRRYHLQPYEMLYFFRRYLPVFALALGDAHSKDVGMFRPVTFFCQTFHLLIFL